MPKPDAVIDQGSTKCEGCTSRRDSERITQGYIDESQVYASSLCQSSPQVVCRHPHIVHMAALRLQAHQVSLRHLAALMKSTTRNIPQ